MPIQKHERPWCHWIQDDFLDDRSLAELKSVPVRAPQGSPGRRVGSERLFINDRHQQQYPNLWRVWRDLHSGGELCAWFSQQTGIDYSELYPRLEVFSDWGDFYLEPHPDRLEKRLTAIVYTDHEKIWPGTQLSDGSRVEVKDNRCFFFVPAADTIHEYPRIYFDCVRRALQINYWTYQE